jgi:hypothetical protein
MSTEGFDVKDQWLGTGDTVAYTFDFTISKLDDLLIYVQDNTSEVVQTLRGSDDVYLSGVTFDPINGGGTVTLVANLPTGYVLTIFLAPDLPDQPSSFPDKSSFSLPDIESALDYLTRLIQRVAWLAQRSIAMHDLDDIDGFNPGLPQNISSSIGNVMAVNAAGTGWMMIQPGSLPVLASDPANPVNGQAYINTTIPAISVYINGAWKRATLS